ncbi:MAG: HNH endonuclease, partial [Pseudobdellovibrionaceae bacterium]|nr:HNH endonuclease [Pseudobdellovibrionaceae bacterium]
AKDLVEATTGYNYIKKQELTRFEMAAAWFGVFTGGYGSKILAAGKVVAMVGVVRKISKQSALAGKLEQMGITSYRVYEAALKANLKSGEKLKDMLGAIRRKIPGGSVDKIEDEMMAAIKRFVDLPRINGRIPRNGHYAGNNYFDNLSDELKSKYPQGVNFKNNGYPDLSPYAKELPNGGKFVKIEPGINRAADFKVADKLSGIKASKREAEGLTWHHSEEYGIMELVPTDIHDAVKHTGGYALWGAGTGG